MSLIETEDARTAAAFVKLAGNQEYEAATELLNSSDGRERFAVVLQITSWLIAALEELTDNDGPSAEQQLDALIMELAQE